MVGPSFCLGSLQAMLQLFWYTSSPTILYIDLWVRFLIYLKSVTWEVNPRPPIQPQRRTNGWQLQPNFDLEIEEYYLRIVDLVESTLINFYLPYLNISVRRSRWSCFRQTFYFICCIKATTCTRRSCRCFSSIISL